MAIAKGNFIYFFYNIQPDMILEKSLVVTKKYKIPLGKGMFSTPLEYSSVLWVFHLKEGIVLIVDMNFTLTKIFHIKYL